MKYGHGVAGNIKGFKHGINLHGECVPGAQRKPCHSGKKHDSQWIHDFRTFNAQFIYRGTQKGSNNREFGYGLTDKLHRMTPIIM